MEQSKSQNLLPLQLPLVHEMPLKMTNKIRLYFQRNYFNEFRVFFKWSSISFWDTGTGDSRPSITINEPLTIETLKFRSGPSEGSSHALTIILGSNVSTVSWDSADRSYGSAEYTFIDMYGYNSSWGSQAIMYTEWPNNGGAYSINVKSLYPSNCYAISIDLHSTNGATNSEVRLKNFKIS